MLFWTTELDFNANTGEAKASVPRKAGGDFALFTYEINKFVAEEINMRSMK